MEKGKKITFSIKIEDIRTLSLSQCFFHYTNRKNLDRIALMGLEPRLGKNSQGIEQSKKIFFAEGDIGMLTIMDVWLRWLILRPNNNCLYLIGAYFLKSQLFPKIIFEYIFKTWMSSSHKHKKACQKLNTILDNSVYLILDLEEQVDYDLDDNDEVKIQNFPKKQLKYIYSETELEHNQMDFWNMHTYSNHVIEPSKISLLKIGDQLSAHAILNYVAKTNPQYIKDNCPFLEEYFQQYPLDKGN